MIYQFTNPPKTSCPNSPAGTVCACHHEIPYSMSKAPSLGKSRKCPVKGCKGRIVRVLSTGIMGHVKGSVYDWKPGETMRMKVGDQDVKMQFIDHKHTDPAYQRNLAEMAGRNNLVGTAAGLGTARYSEKHGRMVVDIGSNVRDPLGVIERAKQKGEYKADKIPVNTPVRVRAKKAKK